METLAHTGHEDLQALEIGEVGHLNWPIAQDKTMEALVTSRTRYSSNPHKGKLHFIHKSSLDILPDVIWNLTHSTQGKIKGKHQTVVLSTCTVEDSLLARAAQEVKFLKQLCNDMNIATSDVLINVDN